jgi:hypothetical protein
MKTAFSNRRAQTFLDIILVMAILFIAAFGFIAVRAFQNNITTEMIADTDLAPEAVAALTNFDNSFGPTLDNIFLLCFVLFWIFVIVSSVFVEANPIFLVLSLILLVIVLIAGAVMANAYEEFTAEGEYYTFSQGFPKTNYIMNHLVMLMAIMAFTGIIAVYGKNYLTGGV